MNGAQDTSNLERLRELTPQLPTLGTMVTDSGESWNEIQAGGGTVFMFGLHKESGIAVARAFLSAGSIVEEHEHPKETEWLIVYAGQMEIVVAGESKIIQECEAICIKPSKPHVAKFPVDTWMLAITIPAAEGYPDAT